MSSHYVASIEIKRVDKPTNQYQLADAKRENVEEIVKVIIKGGDLQELKDKVAAHIGLVSE